MLRKIIAALAFAFIATAALAQSPPTNPPMTYGMVPTVGQWNNWFSQKQNTLGFVPFNVGGGTLLGKLTLVPSATTGSGLNAGLGTAPLSPNPGDMWITSTGVFARLASTTVGPLSGAGGAITCSQMPAFTGDATSPLGSCVNTVVKINGTTINSTPASGLLVGTTDTQTLTGKTIAGGSNTFSAVPLTALASQAANSVVANKTASTGSPTANAMPSCSTATSGLIWTSGTGFGCNTGLGGVASFNGRTGAVVPASADYSSGQLTTNVSGSVPAAGAIGEEATTTRLSGSAVSSGSGVTFNVIANPITAGSWACVGALNMIGGAGSTTSIVLGALTLTSATLPGSPNGGQINFNGSIPGSGALGMATGMAFFNVSSSQTVYLVTNYTLSSGTNGDNFYGAVNCFRKA